MGDWFIQCRMLASSWCMGYRVQSPGKRLARLIKGIRLPGIGVLGKVLTLGASEVYSRKMRTFNPQGKLTNEGFG